jgi:CBS-domain-containing membrane protein
VVVSNNMSWSFLFAPVGIGAVLLTLFAFAWHNLVARGANRDRDAWRSRAAAKPAGWLRRLVS